MFEKPILTAVEMTLAMLLFLGLIFFWVAQVTIFSTVNVSVGARQPNALFHGYQTTLFKEQTLNNDKLSSNNGFTLLMSGEEFYAYVLGKFLTRANSSVVNRVASEKQLSETLTVDLSEYLLMNSQKEYIFFNERVYPLDSKEQLSMIDKTHDYELKIIRINPSTNSETSEYTKSSEDFTDGGRDVFVWVPKI